MSVPERYQPKPTLDKTSALGLINQQKKPILMRGSVFYQVAARFYCTLYSTLLLHLSYCTFLLYTLTAHSYFHTLICMLLRHFLIARSYPPRPVTVTLADIITCPTVPAVSWSGDNDQCRPECVLTRNQCHCQSDSLPRCLPCRPPTSQPDTGTETDPAS